MEMHKGIYIYGPQSLLHMGEEGHVGNRRGWGWEVAVVVSHGLVFRL